MAVNEVWVADLVSYGLEKPIKAVSFVRSLSRGLKVAVATADQIAIITSKDGALENTHDIEEGLAGQDNMKLTVI